MAEKQIAWTKTAEEELKNSLDFYNNRNKSTSYSQKILSLIEHKTNQLYDFPYLGKPSDDNVCRLLVIAHFMLIYEVMDSHIVIHSFWDSRQDPKRRFDNKNK